MGSYGSGRRWGIAGSSKATTGDYLRLDVRQWQREGLLTAGRTFGWKWTRENGEQVGSINVGVGHGRVIFVYRVQRSSNEPWQSKEYLVSLEWTHCNYGGKRTWFLCPAQNCGRRVAILYGGEVFACRHCFNVAYESQREAPHYRALSRAKAIRAKLGGWFTYVDDPPPLKPKGMHQSTYLRLLRKLEEAEARAVHPLWGRWSMLN